MNSNQNQSILVPVVTLLQPVAFLIHSPTISLAVYMLAERQPRSGVLDTLGSVTALKDAASEKCWYGTPIFLVKAAGAERVSVTLSGRRKKDARIRKN